MKKKFLVLSICSAISFGFEVEYVADVKFCVNASLPISVCNYAQNFYNFIDFSNGVKKNNLKGKHIKNKGSQLINRLCLSWEQVPPIGREFLIDEVTYNDNPILTEDDMFELCSKGK